MKTIFLICRSLPTTQVKRLPINSFSFRKMVKKVTYNHKYDPIITEHERLFQILGVSATIEKALEVWHDVKKGGHFRYTIEIQEVNNLIKYNTMNPRIKISEAKEFGLTKSLTYDELNILSVLKEQKHSMRMLEIIPNCAVRHSMLLTHKRVEELIQMLLSKELIISDEMRTNVKLTHKGDELISKIQGIEPKPEEIKKEEFKIGCGEPNCPEILTAANTKYNYLLHKTNVFCFKCYWATQLDIKLV